MKIEARLWILQQIFVCWNSLPETNITFSVSMKHTQINQARKKTDQVWSFFWKNDGSSFKCIVFVFIFYSILLCPIINPFTHFFWCSNGEPASDNVDWTRFEIKKDSIRKWFKLSLKNYNFWQWQAKFWH